MIKEFILKNKVLFLLIFLFTLIVPLYLLASDPIFDSYSATKATSTGSVINATSRTGEPYKIINYSSNSYFIPNKTQPEFGSFLNNSPRYTFYSKCGDGVCLPGELLETPENCPDDCAGKYPYKFCGDGLCSLKTSCIGTIYDCRSLPGDEDYFSCPADCQAPTSIAACGVCGTYFDGGVEKICTNSCDQNRVSLVNCMRPSNVVTYYGDGIIQLFSKIFNKDIKSAGMWYCNPNLTNACPAGKYCGLTGTTAETPQDCWAGHFCPKGSVRPQICPPGYYSAPASATCTACPNYTYSAPGAGNISHCYQLDVCGDETCEGNENPRNCPQDCSIPNDGLCTGTETKVSTPNDCYCGNNNCDKGESPISCIDDCHCGDGVCNYFEHNETPASCSADCYYGNNTCDMGEKYNSSYPNDCKCGNGNCDLGEYWNNCPSDCTCGNGVCNTGENYLNCLLDCPRCGNGICDTGVSIVAADGQIQSVKPETALSFGANYDHCSADCRCGDGICDASESTTCTLDCGCGNGVCTSPTETPLNCRYDCGSCGDGVCAYHYGKIELNDATGLSPSIYHSCPGDCTSTTGSIKKPFMPLE